MLSKESHAERKRMVSSLFTKTYIQNSPDVREILKIIVSGHLRTQLNTWTKNKSVVDVLETGKACLMDITTAWLFGLHHGSDVLRDGIAAEQFFTPFRHSGAGFFWRSEFYKATKQLRRISIHLVPRSTYPARRTVQTWSAKLIENIERSSFNEQTSSSKPIVYSQLRLNLEQSDLPASKLEATLSAELLDHLVASHDVSGIILTYVMYELSLRPELQRVLRAELSSVDWASSAAQTLDAIPMLEAILMETLRLHSANPGPVAASNA